MKKLLIAGLVTAIAAVGLISQASAASRYCMNNPDDENCMRRDGNSDYTPPQDGTGYQPPPQPPPPPVYNGGNGNPPPPPPPRYGDNGYPPPPPRWRHRYQPNYYNDDYYGDNSDQGAIFSFQFNDYGNSCFDIGDSLSRSGFRRVRAVDCAGRDYAYLAMRDGQRLRIRVKAASGRIFAISPY